MQKKPTSQHSPGTPQATRTVTETEVRESLNRHHAGLEPDEEKVLRMRHGAASRSLTLTRVGQDNPDTREKLLSIELELLRQWKARQEPRPAPVLVRPAAPEANPRRDKIVSALRTKKPR